jgi:thiol-disulfide isomerase/thioredoxin
MRTVIEHGAWLLALGAMLLAALGAMLLAGCDASSSGAAPTGSGAPGAGSVDIVAVPAGDEPLSSIVLREQARAAGERRDVVIYVGAPWCEPCQRFHDAAARGELDAQFPTLRLLELDRDRDEKRLAAAGCLTSMIPLFAKPTADGRCDADKRMMGSIKGPGAVADIAPRLRRLLQP